MSIIEQQPHRLRKCVHHYRASAESIVERARQYRSSDISQGCTFVFLANILATFFPGVLAYIPKWASGARAAPSRPRRPRRDADVRSRWLMKVLKRRRCKVEMADEDLQKTPISRAERPFFTAWPRVSTQTPNIAVDKCVKLTLLTVIP